jgi:hypothetical protein
VSRRSPGHALIAPNEGEPWRCRCGWQGDWGRSENYPPGWSRAEARNMYRFHVQDVWLESQSHTSREDEG